MDWSEEELVSCVSLDELRDVSLHMINGLVAQGYEVHHVAGAISADGDEHIPRNIAELLRQRDRVAREVGHRAVVITAPTIFTEIVYQNLKIFEMPRNERETALKSFWRALIGSRSIQQIHFTPGWERSEGAVDEHEAAEEFGVARNYLADLQES